ncbi:Protein bem46 [Porphyridium purpureum]|uniref:Protein bem46 n=1 Tax=Porphyridium purpureum TaxID=35688 RepID=A0A5J4YWN6_PORPP|nr:Protein bem46 [Porphyridium purpureum]|eukprot:POR2942..scf209_3
MAWCVRALPAFAAASGGTQDVWLGSAPSVTKHDDRAGACALRAFPRVCARTLASSSVLHAPGHLRRARTHHILDRKRPQVVCCVEANATSENGNDAKALGKPVKKKRVRSKLKTELLKQRLQQRRKKEGRGMKIALGSALVAALVGLPLTLTLHRQNEAHMQARQAEFEKLMQAPGGHAQKTLDQARSDPVRTEQGRSVRRKLLKVSLILSGSTMGALAVTLLVLIAIQDKLVYKPSAVSKGTPKQYGMNYYDDVAFATRDDVQICGWLVRVSDDPAVYGSVPTMLYFHGRDKNASFRLKKIKSLMDTVNANVLLVSYRGFGNSSGKPTEKGMRIDAQTAMKYIQTRNDLDLNNLWVYGESLGGAVAVDFAHEFQQQLRGLILENTFTSLLDMINRVHPVLTPVRALSRNRWRSDLRMPSIRLPVLFLSGLRDAFIPPVMMKNLYELSSNSVKRKFVEFPGGTHNRTWMAKNFFEEVNSFVQNVTEVAPERETTARNL